ncbi:MAG TPA: hypothetical protein VG694_02405 [Candidatus Paceibacterota bacterium]|jgi:hypothetical protein|nr:hypothetical protein [Candidatus Paceibacterota bacterium]
MEILGKILGSPARVKIMRLFLLNAKKNFTAKEVAKRSRVSPASARSELRMLASVAFIRKRGASFMLNTSFKYLSELEDLLINSESIDKDVVAGSFKRAGRVKLLVVSGVFLKNKDSRVDLLVVGNKMKRSRVEEEIRKLEAEIGRELVYAIFDTKEFNYRLNMYDKLIRDILDFPHEVLLQSKELSTQLLQKA